ncbi:MAG: hypothetical protein Q8Q47_00425 [Ignavibacteriaceae bacterium]|nr:hypothetical protein [Ignavibacteriaceae bacterium]
MNLTANMSADQGTTPFVKHAVSGSFFYFDLSNFFDASPITNPIIILEIIRGTICSILSLPIDNEIYQGRFNKIVNKIELKILFSPMSIRHTTKPQPNPNRIE